MSLDNPKITEPTRVKFTVSDFFKMIEYGILRENSHEDIIDGAIWQKRNWKKLASVLPIFRPG